MAIRRSAFAKVNLALSVHPPVESGPRAGWHEIDSWFHAIDLADDVEVGLADEPTLVREWAAGAPRPSPIDWPPQRDLAWRAAQALLDEAGVEGGWHVTVRKRIPVGAGLGGGSSDAAAVMLALSALLDLAIPVQRLREISAPLGSDIAFFLDGVPPGDPPRPSLVRGFGDRIERSAGREGELLLILPPFGCDTREVYRAFDRLGGRHTPFDEALSAFHNDLAPAAAAAEPRLDALWTRLAPIVPGRCLTGSGSAMFLIDASEATEGAIRRAAPEVALVRSRLV